MKTLEDAVTRFCAWDLQINTPPALWYNAAIFSSHEVCAGILEAETQGYSRQQIAKVVAPARAIHAKSPFIKRLQEWPRGYPGDFETVEYICNSINQAQPDSFAFHYERMCLNSTLAQQHRNTNLAKINPHRVWMEYLVNWDLIERSEEEIMTLCAEAGIGANNIAIQRDLTDLTLLVEVVKPA